MYKAVFLDRDGVINKVDDTLNFIHKTEHVSILPRVKEAVQLLKKNGYLCIVITNQPVIARGISSEVEVKRLHEYINKEIGNLLDAFYMCPHHPEMHPDVPEYAKQYRIACSCRKPLPGMILQAAHDLSIDLAQSWMVGDMVTDIVAGKKAGCHTAFVESPHSKRITKSSTSFDTVISADISTKSLYEAACKITAHS